MGETKQTPTASSTPSSASTDASPPTAADRIGAAIDRLDAPPAGKQQGSAYQSLYRIRLRLDIWLATEHPELVDELEALADRYDAQVASKGLGFLPFDETAQPAGIVDASGVVLTPSDIAEARIARNFDPDGDSLTVEFADGTKGCWPDDWAGKVQTLAAPGGHMRLPGDGPTELAQVVRLLDLATAEVVAEWSAEDEDARLLASEVAAAADEAAEDRAAVVELEALADRYDTEVAS